MDKNDLYKELRKKINIANRRIQKVTERYGEDTWRS